MYLKQCLVTSNVEFFKGNVGDIIKSHKTIKHYAYILHDKDVGQSPHWTIYLNFGSSGVDTKQVGEWFGLQESQVERIKGRKTDALQYLTHSNDTQHHKYQYPVSEVIANFDFETEIENSKILGDFENYSYAQQLQYVNSLPLSEKAQAFSRLRKLWELQCQLLTLNTDRQIQVIFITGKPEAGKTYYAKKLLTSQGYDFCVSSSSNDPFQDYMGQKAIILDDLRDTAFGFEDLLKLLDNNTASSVKSRFSNKVFNGEMIVITSSVPLVYWYKDLQFHSSESLQQLYRRISCYVVVTDTEVIVYDEGLDKYGKPQGLGQNFKNELADKKKELKPKVDYKSMFGKFCESSVDGSEVFAVEQLKINSNIKK
ncbi:MAG: hypothetical protein K2K38_04950 [Clostridia bacterium]|nr:hypothetical protein [Clostridia bacterium]